MLARRVDVDEIVRQTRPADQLRRAAIGDQCSCAAVPSREMQSGAGHARPPLTRCDQGFPGSEPSVQQRGDRAAA
jgi:hypothetical protein